MSAAATTAERVCQVCGTSIEELRPQASTCSDACRQAKRRGRARPLAFTPPPTRPTCTHGRPPSISPGEIEGLALQGKWLRLLNLILHPAALPDEDGDPVCTLCGTLVGIPSRPNGHEATLEEMETDADGQDRRRPRKIEHYTWRDWQPFTAPVIITREEVS